MTYAVQTENRRFTCLAPGLVRLEFAPDGRFNDRRSLVAYEQQRPVPFAKIEKTAGEWRLHTGGMTIVSRQHDRDFFEGNLEIRWERDGLVQFWRPGDRDHLNLGGTVRALDLQNRYAPIQGVHTADDASPDAKANVSLNELCCEVDVPYYRMSPAGEAKLAALRDTGCIHKGLLFHPDAVPVRTRNHILDQRRFAPGILSRAGYFLLNDSDSPLLDDDDFPVERRRPGCRDWYFFCYNGNYAQALRDFGTLCGRAPLPPRTMFGLVFSRWPAYDETEARQILDRFQSEGIPLSTLMLDMEWHKPGWNHWEWNPQTYPDPRRFMNECHRRGVSVALNVHPECIHEDDVHFAPFRKCVGDAATVREHDFRGKKCQAAYVDIADKRQALAFMDICQTPKIRDGADFWWLDGAHGQINGGCSQLLSNKLFFENAAVDDKRPTLLSRYGGLGSHRYGVTFTGDTASQWEVLKLECEFNIRAGHVGLAYVSHDIGGFSYPESPLMDPILYLRWLQFGVFNPVLRFHSSPGSGSRQPWDYGAANARIAKRWLAFRNSLVPYLYSQARQHYDTGTPIVRGLFFDHPEDDQAYCFDQFLFGDRLLVAPMLEPRDDRRIYLPTGLWFDYASGTRIQGPTELHRLVKLGDVPLFAKAGTILPRRLATDVAAVAGEEALLLELFPGATGEAVLYEDDGGSLGYLRGEFALTRYEMTTSDDTLELKCPGIEGEPFGPAREYTLEVVCERAPRRITCNASELACDFDPATSRCRVRLPRMTATQAWTVTITLGCKARRHDQSTGTAGQ